MGKLSGLIASVALAIGLAVVLAAPPAGACSCTPYEGRAETADAVFVGRLESSDRGGSSPTSGVRKHEDVQIDVERVHRGEVHRTQHAIASSGGPCGEAYDAQERLFFAFVPEREVDGGVQPDGVYAVNACTSLPVAELSPALLRELEALGPPTDPLPGASPTAIESPSRVRPTATERRWILASIVTVVALGSAVALVRRRRAAGSGLDGPVA